MSGKSDNVPVNVFLIDVLRMTILILSFQFLSTRNLRHFFFLSMALQGPVVEKLDHLINNSNLSTYTLYINLCHQCDILHHQVILPFQLTETHLLLEI